MKKVVICGALGKMGANIKSILDADGEAEALCGIDPRGDGGKVNGLTVYPSFAEMQRRCAVKPDVIIDFSSPAALADELEYAAGQNVPVVIGSTGFTPEQLKAIDGAANKVAVFRTANFSLGVNLVCELVKKAAETLGEKFDIEIIEKHHNQKVDAPSGTALMIADSARSAFDGGKEYLNGRSGICGKRGSEIGIHAVRGGTIVGEHEALFCGEDEIITISHSARSKKVFAAGAVRAAKWLCGRSAALYNMADILGD